MGHGDEIVIADGNFPAETCGQRVVRADGHGGEAILDAVLSLIPLDTYALENLLLMQTTNGDPTPEIWDKYFAIAKKHDPNLRAGTLERFEFYERAKKAYAVVVTGEGAIYANVILKKGVVK
jgi:L-fucose mutarotase